MTTTGSVQVVWVRRTSLEDVIDQLVKRMPPDPDAPATAAGRRALLDQLAVLVPASQQMISDDPTGGARGKGSSGSPAPWSARPAELLDEVLRGAARFDRAGRLVLGWPGKMVPRRFAVPLDRAIRGPVCARCEHVSCDRIRWQPIAQIPLGRMPIAAAGREALLGLPGLVHELERVHHPLGVRVDENDPDRRRQGLIEEQVRRWHRQIMNLVGRDVPWQRLPAVPNPDHPKFAGGQDLARRGPVCQSCAHRSCERIRCIHSRWLPWLCPRCGCDSLRMDPVEGMVRCLRPACAEDGEASWSKEDLSYWSLNPWGDDDRTDDDTEDADAEVPAEAVAV